MNVSMFSLRPKGRLRRSSASLQDMEVLGGEEPVEVKKSKSERVRTRGGVFRTHSGESFSENTGETMIDPSSGSDDDKPKRRGKKMVKSRIGKLFRIKKSGKSKSKPKEEQSHDEHNTSSFETTSRVDSHDFSQEVSQAEIAEWVREQRSIKAKKDSLSSMSSHKVKNKTRSKKKKKSEESLTDEEEIEKPLSVLVVDESIKLSTTSLLTTPDFDLPVLHVDESTKPSSASLLTAPDFDLTTTEEISDDIEDQSQPSIAKPCKPESRASRSVKSKENKAPSSTNKPPKPPKPQSQTSRSDKSKEKKSESLTAKTSTPHPTKLQSSRSMGSQTSQSNRTPSSRRQRNFRREKNELDVTDHTSTSVKDDDSPSKTNTKRQEVSSSAISHSPPATIVAAEESINPRRRYPSKKHLRKKTRNNKSAVKTKGGSNRIDVTGEVSSPNKPLPKDTNSTIVSEINRSGNNSAVKAKGGSKRIDFTGEVSKPLPKDTDSSIVSEINRLGSVVDIMMKRMAMYEKQTDCLVKASLAENEVRNKKVLQECDSSHSVNTNTKQESTAGTAVPPQDWVRKLGGMQKGYRRRLTTTKRQLKELQTEQAMMNRKIVMSYEERLKLKDSSAHRNPEGGKVEGSTRSRSYRSMSSRTRSHRARAEHSRSNRSGSNRSLLPNNRSIGEASSMCDSAKVEMSLDMEDSCHTASTTRSERSVSFNPTVNVATTLSRYDMCPREQFSYWVGDGDDDMTEEILTYLSEKWKVRNLVHEVEEELSSPSQDKREAPPFHSISDSIKQLLPPTEREGNEGYTYTTGIQN